MVLNISTAKSGNLSFKFYLFQFNDLFTNKARKLEVTE